MRWNVMRKKDTIIQVFYNLGFSKLLHKSFICIRNSVNQFDSKQLFMLYKSNNIWHFIPSSKTLFSHKQLLYFFFSCSDLNYFAVPNRSNTLFARKK